MRQLTSVYKALQWNGFKIYPLLQVHDELIWEAEEEIADMVIPTFHDIMVNAVQLSVPIRVDTKTGYNWKDMEKWNG